MCSPRGSDFIRTPLLRAPVPPHHAPASLLDKREAKTKDSSSSPTAVPCGCPWFSFPPVSWDGQFLLSSCQRLTPPGDRPSHLLSPRQETFLILSPPSLPRLFRISIQYASVLHPLFAHPPHSTPWLLLPPPPNLPGSLMTCTLPDSVLVSLYLSCVPQPMAMPSSLKQLPSQLLGTTLSWVASYLPDGSFPSPCWLLLCLTSE